ncbi:hypothetical protein Bca52824_048290 [Brassica carinata]|uniref:Uncharacterized protein n=1 Tax=Brassica carinata TaxID=52824 RepID=A0A8X7RI37_BRACI|nr:hypothetical protein Bca52824_048290 [Brassica carinata]
MQCDNFDQLVSEFIQLEQLGDELTSSVDVAKVVVMMNIGYLMKGHMRGRRDDFDLNDRSLNKKRMEEGPSDRFNKGDAEEFNEAWRHGSVITGVVQQTYKDFTWREEQRTEAEERAFAVAIFFRPEEQTKTFWACG